LRLPLLLRCPASILNRVAQGEIEVLCPMVRSCLHVADGQKNEHQAPDLPGSPGDPPAEPAAGG